MNINILHVSDLHRDPFSPISNLTLLDSLKRDRDQYASPDDLGISSLESWPGTPILHKPLFS